MIKTKDLVSLARARIEDAQALCAAGRYDGAVYICGYAVEVALKARICKTLKWDGFPETAKEFVGKTSLKIHDLNMLLHYTGVEAKIRRQHATDWALATSWSPELRYRQIGTATLANAQDAISAAKNLIGALK